MYPLNLHGDIENSPTYGKILNFQRGSEDRVYKGKSNAEAEGVCVTNTLKFIILLLMHNVLTHVFV